MSKPTLFLDTTIQIERVVSHAQRRTQLQETLSPYRLITSSYVLGEFLRTLVKDAIQLHQRIEQYAHLDEVITDLGQHPNKRVASRMMLILGTLLRGNRTAQSTFDAQTRLQIQDRLARYIDFGLLDHFFSGLAEIIDNTQCGLARERPAAAFSSTSDGFVYQLRSQCVRHVRECDLAEQMQSWRPELRALADGLTQETDPVLLRMGELAQKLSEDPVWARGRNCTWYLGDLIIALELPLDVPLYTTNLRHFAPILAILGKRLYKSDSP